MDEMHEFIDGLHGLSDEQRASRKADWDQKQAAIRAVHGVPEPVAKTPEQVARERLEQHWQPPETNPDTQRMVDAEVARIAELPSASREQLVERAKASAGGQYDQLLAAAQTAPGWRPEIAASLPLLRLFAGQARYDAARARSLGLGSIPPSANAPTATRIGAAHR